MSDDDLLTVGDHLEIGAHAATIGERALKSGDDQKFDESLDVLSREVANVERKGGDARGLRAKSARLRDMKKA